MGISETGSSGKFWEGVESLEEAGKAGRSIGK